MPMTLSAGLSKKLGLPDFGSLGASCSVTVELDQNLLRDDLEAFHRHVRSVYAACAQAVHEELARQQGTGTHPVPVSAPQQQQRAPGLPPNGSGNGSAQENGGHSASQKQMEYIQQLARQIKGLGTRRLELLANKMFSKSMAALSSLDASGLIDTLKAIKAGEIDLDNALNGAAT